MSVESPRHCSRAVEKVRFVLILGGSLVSPMFGLAETDGASLPEGVKRAAENLADASSVQYRAAFVLIEEDLQSLTLALPVGAPLPHEEPAYQDFDHAVATGEIHLIYDGETLYLRETTLERKHFDTSGNEMPFDFAFMGERRYWFHPDGTTTYTEQIVSEDQPHRGEGKPVHTVRKTSRDVGDSWIDRAVAHQVQVELGWRNVTPPPEAESMEAVSLADGQTAWRSVDNLSDSLKSVSHRTFDPESHLVSEVWNELVNEVTGEVLLSSRFRYEWSSTEAGWFQTSYTRENDSYGRIYNWTITEGPLFQEHQVEIPPIPEARRYVDQTMDPPLATGVLR